MDTADIDRIKKIIEESGLNQKDFCEYCSISPSTLSGVLKGKSGVTLQLIMNIHKAFPKYTLDWLIKGVDLPSESPLISEVSNTVFEEDLSSNKLHPTVLEVPPKYTQSSLLLMPEVEVVASTLASNHVVEHQDKKDSDTPEMVKYIERPPRQVVEIRIFFDDGTYQTLTPQL